MLNLLKDIDELQQEAFKNDFVALDFICMFLFLLFFKFNILIGYTFILGCPVGLLGVNVAEDG